ncbi:phosphatase PAP2 family protein [Oceaniserpentilla sp. 4NH20-0058]|uniref:phosphatase PAP2 family protein n=1 Tax=Oceaniserpentilla sp. 4NH20-0058 TaxID=3127660 RepID=UPI0031077E89
MLFFKRHWSIPLFILVSCLFIVFPQVDLWLSGLFWNGTSGEKGFTLNENGFVQFVYWVFLHIPKILIPVLLFMLVLPWFKQSLQPTRKYSGFLLLVLLVGPGIIVHPILKDNWDRPRPRDVQQFGGEREFTPAFIVTEQPGRNQSFASGHGAMGFFFMAFAWVFRKRRYLLGGLVIGAIVSMGRIVQGGHFLSDVVTAGFIVYFTAQILSYYMLGYSRIKPSTE